MEMEIRISGDSEYLSDLHGFFVQEGESVQAQPLFKRTVGVSHEPLVVALVVALGGPVLIKEFIGLIKHYMTLKHLEKMGELHFQIVRSEQEIEKKLLTATDILVILEQEIKDTQQQS